MPCRLLLLGSRGIGVLWIEFVGGDGWAALGCRNHSVMVMFVSNINCSFLFSVPGASPAAFCVIGRSSGGRSFPK